MRVVIFALASLLSVSSASACDFVRVAIDMDWCLKVGAPPIEGRNTMWDALKVGVAGPKEMSDLHDGFSACQARRNIPSVNNFLSCMRSDPKTLYNRGRFLIGMPSI